MLGGGAGEIETLMAGAEHLKKTVIIKGKSTVVPGYETAMCVVAGLTMFFAIQFLLMASEYVFCSPHLIMTTLNLDYAAAKGTMGHASRL